MTNFIHEFINFHYRATEEGERRSEKSPRTRVFEENAANSKCGSLLQKDGAKI